MGKDKLQESIKEANKYKYDQSSKASELIRKIVFAIIGSCWVLMFTQGQYHEANVFLKITIALGFIYLLFDVLHYFCDACSYHHHAQKMEEGATIDYLEKTYKPANLHISRRSFVFFVLKVSFCIAVSIAFLLGLLIKYII